MSLFGSAGMLSPRDVPSKDNISPRDNNNNNNNNNESRDRSITVSARNLVYSYEVHPFDARSSFLLMIYSFIHTN
jgi:hypothetical protein